METSRRNFLKTMGIATAAAAVFNPANLFANNPAKSWFLVFNNLS